MYSKYRDISANVKNLRTCGACYERPIFFCDDDFRIHERNCHRSYQEEEKEDLLAIKSQLSLLTNLLSRQINIHYPVCKESKEERRKDVEEEIICIKRRMVGLESEVDALKKTCMCKCSLQVVEGMCSSCVKLEKTQNVVNESQNAGVFKEVEEFKLKNKLLQNELENKTKEFNQLKEQRSNDKKKLRKMKDLFDAKQKKIEKMEEELNAAQKDKIEMTNCVESVKQKNIRIKGQLNAERQRRQNCSLDEANDQKEKLLKVESVCESLQEEVRKLNDEKMEYVAEVERFRSLLRDKEASMKQLQSDADNLTATEKEKEEYEMEIKKVNALLVKKFDAFKKLKVRCEELERIIENKERSEEELKLMKILLAEKDGLVKELQDYVKEKEQQVQQEIKLQKQRDCEVSTLLKRVQDYENAVVELKAKIDELVKQLDDNNNQKNLISFSLAEKENDLEELSDRLRCFEEQHKTSMSMIQKLSEEKRHISDDLTEIEDENKKLFNSKADLQLKLDELNDKLQDAVQDKMETEERLKRMDELEQELFEVNKGNELLQAHKEELMTQLTQMTDKMKHQAERYEWRLNVADKNVDELEKELADVKWSLKKADREIRDLKLEHRDMLSAAEQVEKLNKEFTLEEEQFEEMSKKLEEKSQIVKEIEEKNEEYVNTNEKLKKEVLEKDKCLEIANKKVNDLNIDLEKVKNDCTKKSEMTKQLTTELQAKEKVSANLEKKTLLLQESESELEKAEENITTLSKQLSDLQEELDKAQRDLSKASTECESEELDKLKQQNEICELKKLELVQNKKDLEEELSHLKEAHSLCDGHKRRLEEDKDNIHKQLHSVETELNATLHDFEKTKHDLNKLQIEITRYENLVKNYKEEKNEAKGLKRKVKELEAKVFELNATCEMDVSKSDDNIPTPKRDWGEKNMKERENEERRDVCVSDEIELKFHEMDYKEINIEMNTSEGDNGEKKVASIKIDKIKSGMTENNEVRVDILTSTGNKDEVDSDASTSETGLIQPISGSINMLAAPQSNNDESISENIGKGCEESVASDISTSFKDDEGEICPSSDDDYSNESFEIEDDEIVIPDNSAEDKMIDTSQSNESKSTRKDKEITLNIKKDKIEKHYLPANKMTIFSKNDDGDNCPVSNNDNLNESFEIKKDKMVIPENSVKYKVIENYQSRKGYTNHNIKQNDDMLSSYEDSNFKLLSNPSSLCKKLAPLLTSKNRLEKLSPSNHKRDSSVFDLPPLPVTGSSSTLIKNKNSAIQECQPLNKVSDHDKSIKDEFNDASKGGDIDIFMSTSNHVEADANSSMKKQDEGDSDASTSETGFIQPIAGSLNMFAAPQSKNDKFDESINEEIGEECEESVASDISTSFKEDENDICPLSDDDDLNKSFEIEDDEMVIPDNSVEDKKIDICQSNERKLTVNIKEVKTENQSSHANEISTSSKNDKSDKGHLSNDDDLDKSVECKKYEMVIPDDSADNKMIFTCQPSQKDDELSSYEDSNFKLLSNPSSLCKKLAPLPTLKNKFGKLPPLNHKRDSSVFDLPPLPVTVSSSSLIKNKNSATQKCQPLDKVSDHDKSIKDEFNDASKGCDIDIFMSTSNHVEADANSSMENQDEVHSDASTSETGFIQPIAGSPNMFAAPQPKNDKFDESISEEIGEECEESVASDISTSFKEDEIDICPSSNDDDLNESFEIEDDEMVIPDNSAEDKKMIVTCQPSNGKTIRNIEERDDELSSYEDSNFKLLSNPSSLCKKLAPLSISKNRLGKLPPLNHKQDSSVFDLPPLPVTGSSSSLINKKNSATQECQLLAENTDNDNSTKDEFNDASKGGNIDIFMSTSNDVEADANSSMEKQDEVDSDASTSETGFMQPIAGSLNMFAAPQSKNDKFDESISEEIGEECEESVASDISSSSKENEVDICPLSDDDDLNKSFEIEDGEMVIPDNGADNKMILTCQPSKGKTIRNIEERDDELSSYEDSNFKLLSNPSSLCKKLAPLSISKNRLGKLPPLNHKQDSSVFDLPPLPVTDSSSMLINNKDSATQECQPLDHDDSNNDDDDVNFDDIDALLLDLDEFDSKRANKEPRAY